MKKIAFAVVLCANASFSPALAQSTATGTGTFSRIVAVSEYQMTVTNGFSSRVSKVMFVKLNGTDILRFSTLDPDAANKLSGATCTFSGPSSSVTATCTK
jgi:hypothetical protein